MKQLFYLTCLLLLSGSPLLAQKYVTHQGYAHFYSDAPLEKIEAKTHKVSCALNSQTGDLVLKIPLTTFTFQKPLMQKHFNEKYIESNQYPYAYFKGIVANTESINFAKEGTYPAEVKGELTLHGITQAIQEKGTFTISKGKIIGNSVFTIRIADYKIKIPKIVFYTITEEVEVTIKVKLNKVE